jgi:predicted O-methyltransferase YrrM
MPLPPRLKVAARQWLRGRNGRLHAGEFEAPDWDLYRSDIHAPFQALEDPARERQLVGSALDALVSRGILAHARYDEQRLQRMRVAVHAGFDIPWTAISPRVERLIYAINAIHQPAAVVAAGVFCGFTFISNAGAAVGPGACYTARELIGLEIDPAEAARAERNIRRIDPTGVARVLAQDAVDWCTHGTDPIDLLYLDADEGGATGKSIYRRITDAAWSRLPPGALLLAHNSINSARALGDYLDFVRDRANCRASVNVALDWEGIEVSIK